MPDKPAVLMLDKPHFQVKLHSDLLKVDLKDGALKELEKLAEARPALRDTLGWMFQTIIPLDVHLWEIEKVTVEPSGNVNIRIHIARIFTSHWSRLRRRGLWKR